MTYYTADLFMSLDGFGTGPVGYWGKEGPELSAERRRVFFEGQGETLVLGANTYRAMEGFAAEAADNPDFQALTARTKLVVSRTLKAPLSWPNSTLIAEDAVTAVTRLKQESPVPLRSHGSISMNRALLAAGLVDRLEILVFPVITGASGSDPILAGLPDIDLELVDSRLLDGRIQHLAYVPTVLPQPLGAAS
ncbi:dihydrofolate reductase family protein [Verrucosispora sp. ts21]|uniref:dihydrofolate reductase family protein n=1 Tax=Verrucosispora sp. ts21 TaxID=2069341 RepID=UPI001E39756B|nr:dihydrofolate reductase family protein [Verrucosispora sp. ts21]